MTGKNGWVARTVTYGAVGLMIATCLLRVEAWPLTSLHLFSSVRTSESVALEMIAITDNDSDERQRVLPRDKGEVMGKTSHLFRNLPGKDTDQQNAMVNAWLAASSVDRKSVKSVQVERVTREMGDESTQWNEVERKVIWELAL